MEYCLGGSDGSATMWTGQPDLDLDGDGQLDAVGLDFDGDGRLDDAMGDLDGDGLADHAALDLDDNGSAESYFTDDGSGTWAVTVDRSGQLRWFGLDGVEHPGGQERSDSGIGPGGQERSDSGIGPGGPTVDFDGDGQVDDMLIDSDDNGLADRAMCGELAYVDTDGDGRWDLKLADTNGDGNADTSTIL